MRSERARVREDTSIPSATRADLLKRLDGIATILAQIAARDTSLLTAARRRRQARPGRAADAPRLAARVGRRARRGGPRHRGPRAAATRRPGRRSQPGRSCRSRCPRERSPTRSSRPTSAASRATTYPSRLAGWDLLSPLYRAFEQGAGGEAASMDLPPTPQIDRFSPPGSAAHGPPVAVPPERPGGSPHLPARRRAGPRQDGPVGHGRLDRGRLPDARRRAERREDQLGPRGRAVDAAAARHRHPRRRQRRRRLRRRLRRQLRDPRPALRLALELRLPLDGRRRGPLHQEPRLAALAAGARPRRPAAVDDAGWQPAPHRPHRHAAHQRRQGLRRHLALPRLDQGRQADRPRSSGASTTPATRPPTAPSTPRPAAPSSTWASCAAARSTSPRTCPTSASPTSPSSSTTTSAARSARPSVPSGGAWPSATAALLAARATGARRTASRTPP